MKDTESRRLLRDNPSERDLFEVALAEIECGLENLSMALHAIQLLQDMPHRKSKKKAVNVTRLIPLERRSGPRLAIPTGESNSA